MQLNLEHNMLRGLVLNPPYWNVNADGTRLHGADHAVLNPPYWNVNLAGRAQIGKLRLVLNPPYWNVNEDDD